MRLRLAGASLAVLVLAGCGAKQQHHQQTTTRRTAEAGSFDVRVVGPLHVALPGVRATPGRLNASNGAPLVVVSASVASAQAVSAAAAANPTAHYVLVGASTKGFHQPNLVGIVFRDDQAARLGGILAGLVAGESGGRAPRVAWVGPGTQPVRAAFKAGVHAVDGGATVLDSPSPSTPSRCKEAALTAFLRGALAVMAGHGLCAAAVEDAATEQNRIAVGLGDFELPAVPVAVVVRSAMSGVYHGGEDLVFGFSSGAIGVRRLDPRTPADVGVQVRRAAQQLGSGSPVAVD